MLEYSPQKPTILIVEDEALLRLMAAEYLKGVDFETLTADSAEEAIALLESRSDIRYAFIDIHLNGQALGDKLAAIVRDRWPPVQIILTSAYYASDRVAMPDGALFMPKPYDLAKVASTFRNMYP